MAKPLVTDEFWAIIRPLLPLPPPRRRSRERRGGRPRADDRAVLAGIVFVLRTGIPWAALPRELGCGSGMTCWRRLRDWHRAGVWHALHRGVLDRLNAAGKIDWSRAVAGSARARARAMRGGEKRGRAPSTAGKWARSTTCSSTAAAGSRSRSG